MPTIIASIDYLQNLPLYKTEKPYYCLLAPKEGYDPNSQRLDNLEYEAHNDISIRDMRDLPSPPTLSTFGFEVLNHKSDKLGLSTRDEVEEYRAETEQMLREALGAVYVKCYEVRKRENIPIERSVMDYNNPLLIEGPAKGAHNGTITW
jgi:hypothetical protein